MRIFKLPPYLIRLLISYFTERKFRIVNGDHTSGYFDINNGCVAGSCMGPLAFTLFINDISNAIELPHVLYADDLVVYVNCTNFDEGFS